MLDHNCHCHHRYISSGDHFCHTKEDANEVNRVRGNLRRRSINGHVDYPFDLNILFENAVLEEKTQLIYPI